MLAIHVFSSRLPSSTHSLGLLPIRALLFDVPSLNVLGGQVQAGDKIHLRSITDLDRPTPEYTFEVQVEPEGGPPCPPGRVTFHN